MSVDIRKWLTPHREEIFRLSSTGFTIIAKEKIAAFSKMQDDITTRLKEVDKREKFINTAYIENYSFDDQFAPAISVVDVEKFNYLLTESIS